MSVKEREIVAYHESGHAIVASVLPGLDPVHKISIVQRGFGALGYTMQLPLEDRYLLQRRDLHAPARRCCSAGRSAEEIAFGEISTGAQNDLQRASDIARAMVAQLGMSERLGAVSYEQHRSGRFLETGVAAERGAARRNDRAADRRRGAPRHRRRARDGAQHPAPASRRARRAVEGAAGEGSDRGARRCEPSCPRTACRSRTGAAAAARAAALVGPRLSASGSACALRRLSGSRRQPDARASA